MKKILVSVVIVIVILTAVYLIGFATPTKEPGTQQSHKSATKPVVLLVIDSLMDQPLQEAVQKGKAPALKFLMENGHYEPEVVASYPTMSVTIDSTILTGTYAEQHRVPGLVWYNQAENRLINYGSGMQEVVAHGVKQVLHDGVVNLNQSHLSKEVQTLYEDLHERQYSSASINGLIYRGDVAHPLNIPKAGSALNLMPANVEVKGPSLLAFGSLSQYNPKNSKQKNIWQKLGFNDKFSAAELTFLIKNNLLPSFSFVYFPGLDQRVHKSGPEEVKGIEQLDQQLQEILNSYPYWEESLEKAVWIVYGDSGQSRIKKDRDNALIDLRSLLNNYQKLKLGKPVTAKDQIALAVNERMAYIYLLNDKLTYEEVASQLKKDSKLGFIAWKDDGMNRVSNPELDSNLLFSPQGNHLDAYGQKWELIGDTAVLDIKLNNRRNIDYGDFPDALARLHGALHSHEGRFLVVDAKPGFEFSGDRTPVHLGGGGHGSLHRDDSISPMIVAGTTVLPKLNRAVDFKDWILKLTK